MGWSSRNGNVTGAPSQPWSLCASSRNGNGSGAPRQPWLCLQQEQGTHRDVHTSWTSPPARGETWQLQGHLCSHGSLCLSAAPVCSPSPYELPQKNLTPKFTLRHVGAHHGAGSTALGVSISPGASEPHTESHRVCYEILYFLYNSYSINFKHQISLGVFLRNGPLAFTEIAETNQMELDRPQHQTSARQSS